ncbi:hypothetical protein IFM89_028474, partial [Coptis chinensis]
SSSFHSEEEMPGEETAGPVLLRLLAFVGAGVICTSAINLWRDLERKAAQREKSEIPEDKLGSLVKKAVE